MLAWFGSQAGLVLGNAHAAGRNSGFTLNLRVTQQTPDRAVEEKMPILLAAGQSKVTRKMRIAKALTRHRMVFQRA
jgi:hypothetical protein